MPVLLDTGVGAVVDEYAVYGPLLASFLANLLATFGDKGQLVVFMLASKYDYRDVFVGATAAFALWSAVEVALGVWITRQIPAGVMTVLTGGLFLAFGLWTLLSAARQFRARRYGSGGAVTITEGGYTVGLAGRVVPDRVFDRIGTHGGLVTSFVFIMFAEFGDKTQLLTINLAATFPDAPVAVFVGVVAALALRTGVDAVIGDRFERWVPTRWVELAAAAVFVAFGLVVLGYLPPVVILALLAVIAALGVGGLVYRRR
ncbi:MAG: TMEM165/GDT1 family protein [Haloarculaceae archaeon]